MFFPLKIYIFFRKKVTFNSSFYLLSTQKKFLHLKRKTQENETLRWETNGKNVFLYIELICEDILFKTRLFAAL